MTENAGPFLEPDALRLYLFEGLPLYTDLSREGEIKSTTAWVRLRLARLKYRARHKGRDPRYLTYFAGEADASRAMDICRECTNERPVILGRLICFCTYFDQH